MMVWTLLQGVETKSIWCRRFVSAPGSEQAGSQLVMDNGLLCTSDHIHELLHAEAISAVNFLLSNGITLCLGKIFDL